jgi:DNA-binding MarR family transcriptional regulator
MRVEECIFFQMSKASRAATRFWGKRIAPYNVTPVQGMVLNFLYEEDAITSKKVTDRTDLDSATLTGILDRLETIGLLERRANPKDRRAILVCLTTKGRAVACNLHRAMEEANKAFLKEYSHQEQAALRSMLRRAQKAREIPQTATQESRS